MSWFIQFVMILIDVCALLNVILIVDVLFGADLSYTGRKLAVCSALFWGMEVIFEFGLHWDGTILLTALEYLYMFGAVLYFATQRKLRTAFLSVPAVLIYVQWGNIGYLIEILFGLDKYTLTAESGTLTPSMFLVDLALVLLLVLLKRARNSVVSMKLTVGEVIFLCVFCIFSPTLVVVLESLESVFNNNIYNLMWVVLVLAMNVAVIYGIYNRKRARYYKNLSESYRQQFDEEYSYFKEYKDNNKSMMKFRHDWNNHMIVMQDLLEQGKYEEAKQYFDTFPVVSKGNTKKLLTGNETVDTILAAKADLFVQNQVEVRLEGELTRLVSIEPVDICILFSNLIDNAIEACSRCENARYFHINVTESPGMLMIVLKNSMAGGLVKDGENIKSTKEENAEHGIGLQNVKEIVEKYKGEVYIETQEGQFVVKLVLPV